MALSLTKTPDQYSLSGNPVIFETVACRNIRAFCDIRNEDDSGRVEICMRTEKCLSENRSGRFQVLDFNPCFRWNAVILELKTLYRQ